MHLSLLRTKILLKNKVLLILSILVPFIFFQFIGVIFKDSGDLTRIQIAIIDNDNSYYSNEIIKNLNNNELLNVIETDYENARSLLIKNRVEAIYIFKKGLSERITEDNLEKIIQLYYLDDSFVATATSDIVAGEILPIIGDIKTAKNVAYLYDKNNILEYDKAFEKSLYFSRKLRKENEFSLPIKFNYKIPNSDEESKYILDKDIIHKNASIGLSIAFTTLFLVFSSSTILKEKESNVYKRIKVCGYNSLQISISNLLGIFTVGIALLTIQFLTFFKYIELTSLYQMINVISVYIAYTLCISSLIVLLTTIFKNYIALQSFGLPFVMFLALLGGCFFSVELLPKKAQLLTAFNPMYWGVDGLFKTIILGLSFSSIKTNIIILLFIAIIFNIIDNIYNFAIKSN